MKPNKQESFLKNYEAISSLKLRAGYGETGTEPSSRYMSLNTLSFSSYAFYNCSALESVTIPASVTSVGEYVFYGCSSVTIYCEAENRPTGWSTRWNNDSGDVKLPVVWGYQEP